MKVIALSLPCTKQAADAHLAHSQHLLRAMHSIMMTKPTPDSQVLHTSCRCISCCAAICRVLGWQTWWAPGGAGASSAQARVPLLQALSRA